MNITVLSVVHGDWFERFGARFIETLEHAACDNAVLVSDKKVSVPGFVNLIVKPFERHCDFLNTANDALETEWGMWLGFDDLLLPGALTKIKSDADIYGWPHKMGGIRSGFSTYTGNFEQTHIVSHNPMAGGFAYRKEFLSEFPFRDYIYLDWIQFAEASYFGATFEPSPVPRTMWMRYEDSLSVRPHQEAEAQVRAFKDKLNAGLIKKGVPE
jgi:hypothetical protein